MPLIDYTCSRCGETFEKFLYEPQDTYEGCKACGEGPSYRIISLVNFIADNTGEAITRKMKKESKHLSDKIRNLDHNVLEDVYGPEKARQIYKGAENALQCKPPVKKKYEKAIQKFKQRHERAKLFKRKKQQNKT